MTEGAEEVKLFAAVRAKVAKRAPRAPKALAAALKGAGFQSSTKLEALVAEAPPRSSWTSRALRVQLPNMPRIQSVRMTLWDIAMTFCDSNRSLHFSVLEKSKLMRNYR